MRVPLRLTRPAGPAPAQAGVAPLFYSVPHNCENCYISLTLARTPASIQQFVTEAYGLMNDLPADVQEIIRKNEASGTTQDPEYKQAMEVFNHSFLCRLDPWPDCLTTAYNKVGTFGGLAKLSTGMLKTVCKQ